MIGMQLTFDPVSTVEFEALFQKKKNWAALMCIFITISDKI